MIKWAWPETLTLKGPLGWILASLASFIVFLFLTFPYGPLEHRLMTELNRATGWDVRATDWWREDRIDHGPPAEIQSRL